MKTCPFCAEEIQDAAIVCKHCGRELAQPATPTSGATTETPPSVTAASKAPPNLKRRRLIGLGLVLVGVAMGLIGGGSDAVFLVSLFGWIGFAMMLPGSLLIRAGGGFVLGMFLMAPFVPSTASTSTVSGPPARNDPARESPPAANLTAQARQLAIDGISGYPEILDAAITQQGDSLNLVLVVPSGTPEARARELGDNFVRMTKTFAGDGAPGREIGRGKFDYTVGVYTPSES